MKILTIGETIIDKYNFCEAIGKSGKEPILVLKESNEEQYFGGVLEVLLETYQIFSIMLPCYQCLVKKKLYLKEINKFLPKTIKKDFIFKKNSPTIIKKKIC